MTIGDNVNPLLLTRNCHAEKFPKNLYFNLFSLFILFSATFALAGILQSPFAFCLPLLTVLNGGLIWRYGKVGLCTAIVAIVLLHSYSDVSSIEKIGLSFSLIINHILLLFVRDEIRVQLKQEQQVAQEERSVLEDHLRKAQQEFENERQILIEEAKQRKIEMSALLAQIQSLHDLQKSVEGVNLIDLQKELEALRKSSAYNEGLYKQLRGQFEEKTQVLAETRKELFEAQGVVLRLEKEKELAALDPDLTEIHKLQQVIADLLTENQVLEQENTLLKEK